MDIRAISSNYSAPTPVVPDNTAHLAEITTAAPVTLASAVRKPAEVPSLDQVAHAIKSINEAVQLRAPSIEFSIDEDSKRTIVKVVDLETKVVLRQIPTEDALQIAKSLDRLTGLLVKDKA